jgi:hypothetical protein
MKILLLSSLDLNFQKVKQNGVGDILSGVTLTYHAGLIPITGEKGSIKQNDFNKSLQRYIIQSQHTCETVGFSKRAVKKLSNLR